MYTDPNIPGMLEPELNVRMPRPARLTPTTQFVRILGAAFFIGLVVFLFTMSSKDVSDLRALLAQGRMANATIIDKYEESGKSTTYYLKYQYRADSQPYFDEEQVSESVYDNTGIGAALPITYLPSSPTTDRVGQVDQARVDKEVQNWVLGIGSGCMIIAALLASVEMRYRKQLSLLQEGTAAAGTVVSKDVRRNSKSVTYLVTYSFIADGQQFWQTSNVSSSFHAGVYPGAYVTVLYNPAKPKDCLPYKAIGSATL